MPRPSPCKAARPAWPTSASTTSTVLVPSLAEPTTGATLRERHTLRCRKSNRSGATYPCPNTPDEQCALANVCAENPRSHTHRMLPLCFHFPPEMPSMTRLSAAGRGVTGGDMAGRTRPTKSLPDQDLRRQPSSHVLEPLAVAGRASTGLSTLWLRGRVLAPSPVIGRADPLLRSRTSLGLGCRQWPRSTELRRDRKTGFEARTSLTPLSGPVSYASNIPPSVQGAPFSYPSGVSTLCLSASSSCRCRRGSWL